MENRNKEKSALDARRLAKRGYQLYVNNNNDPEVHSLFKQALKLDPTDHTSAVTLSCFYTGWRKFYWLHRALKAIPRTHADYKYINSLIGDMHLESKKYEKAYRYFKRCISIYGTRTEDLAKFCKILIMRGIPSQNELFVLLWFLRTRIKRFYTISSEDRAMVKIVKDEVKNFLSTLQFSKLREV